MGIFGALFLLATGVAYGAKSIEQSNRDFDAREDARRNGRKYYYAHDGERRVDNNNPILHVSGKGIQDMKTGEWLYNQKAEEQKMRSNFRSENEIAKKEAIIKGKSVYTCKVHESDPKFKSIHDCGYGGYKLYSRLTMNDMPIETYDCIGKYTDEEKKIIRENGDEEYPSYKYAQVLNQYFYLPYNVNKNVYNSVYQRYKESNMRSMKTCCHIYSEKQLKIILKFCQKYKVPMGTWEEIEEMMLEEHPLGWRKVPEIKDWEYQEFVERFIM